MSVIEAVKNNTPQLCKDLQIYHESKKPIQFVEILPKLGEMISREYDEIIGRIGGSTTDRFVLVKGEFFHELFDEVRNNSDCKYVTYLNDIIKQGYTPENVSALIKNPWCRDYALAEVIASKIMNYFSIPVSYYSLAKCGKDIYTLSPDFLKENEEITNLYMEMREFSPGKSKVKDYIQHIFKGIEDSVRDFYTRDDMSREDFDKIIETSYNMKEEYLRMFLIRQMLLNDVDFDTYNVGIIKNREAQTIGFSPVFDLSSSLIISTPEDGIKSIMKIFNNDYPDTLHDFMSKLEAGTKADENNISAFDKMLNSAVSNTEEKALVDIREVLNRNIKNIKDEYKKSYIPENMSKAKL